MAAGGINVGASTLKTTLPLFLMQIIIIIGLSRIVGSIFRRYKQPTVVAEIITGIILGPTVLGHIPNWIPILFAPTNMVPIQMTSQLALIFYMFIIGLELDLEQVKMVGYRAIVVPTMGLVFGVIFAIPLAYIFNDRQYYYSSTGVFIFYMGIVLGISALPVMARILSERGMLGTPFGNYIMACKIVNDIEAWPLIALAVTLSNSGSSMEMVYTIPVVVADILLLLFVLRPLMVRLTNMVSPGELPHWYLFSVIFVLLIWAFATEITGLTGILGALELGIVMPRNKPRIMTSLMAKMEDLVVVILLPLYFAASGLKCDLSALTDGTAWGLCVLIIVAAFLTMLVGAGITSYILGQNRTDALAVGVLMTTKGLVALVAINYGLDGKVISPKFFAMCTVMIVFTTATVVPILNCIKPMDKQRRRSIASQVHGEAGEGTGKSVIVCLENLSSSVALITASRLLCERQDSVLGLRVMPVTDRPTEFVNVGTTTKDQVSEMSVDFAELQRIQLTLQVVTGPEPISDTAAIIHELAPSMALMSFNPFIDDNAVLNAVLASGPQGHQGLLPTETQTQFNLTVGAMFSQHLPVTLQSVVLCVTSDSKVADLAEWLHKANVDVRMVGLDDTEATKKVLHKLSTAHFGTIEAPLANESPCEAVARIVGDSGLIIIGAGIGDHHTSTRSATVSRILSFVNDRATLSAMLVFRLGEQASPLVTMAAAAEKPLTTVVVDTDAGGAGTAITTSSD